MTKNRLSDQPPGMRNLQKTLGYINDSELFLNETDTAVPLLIEVYKKADADLKDEIIFLLGAFAHQPVSAWLYAVMADPGEKESARHSAALQISVTAALMENTDALSEKLLADLANPDAALRRLAVLALGWEGNHRAVTGLAACKKDTDPVIRKTAAVALFNIEVK
jgi:HEAT repeat protein